MVISGTSYIWLLSQTPMFLLSGPPTPVCLPVPLYSSIPPSLFLSFLWGSSSTACLFNVGFNRAKLFPFLSHSQCVILVFPVALVCMLVVPNLCQSPRFCGCPTDLYSQFTYWALRCDSPQASQTQQILPLPQTFPSNSAPSCSESTVYLFVQVIN